jgi:hypothetical protein
MVNRVWQYHFGTGLVESPSDFGFSGGRPSHPELIDWLASELVRSGWSLKQLHRTILTSATYRQASTFRTAAAARDAGNRLLWRRTPLRLEAEALRDAVLQVTGELVDQPGGPGCYEFTTFIRNSQFYEMRDGDGPLFQRRSIYRTWVRSARNTLLDAFDCPDPSTKAPRREVTTTPLQALSLLNNPFVLRMAERFAARVEREVGTDAAAQIERTFWHALGREPDGRERAICTTLVREEGLAALCRVVFNSNEFLYVD